MTRISLGSLGRAIAMSRVARGIPGTSQDTAQGLAVSDVQQSVTRTRWWEPVVTSDYSQGRLRGCASGRSSRRPRAAATGTGSHQSETSRLYSPLNCLQHGRRGPLENASNMTISSATSTVHDKTTSTE